MGTTGIRLKILNEKAPNVLQYLPYGVTTIEMRIELDSNTIESIKYSGPVYIYPRNRSDSNEKNKLFVGYADESKDFLILWGAGKEKGLEVNEHNIGKRLFLQILHKGQTLDSQTISFFCSKLTVPINIIKIVPAVESSADVVRMETIRKKEQQHRFNEIISFKGNKMPLYYPRWFPPRPLDNNNNINYHDVEIPPITIKFKSKNDDNDSIASIDSNIDIFLSNDKIAEISGDWHYSSPHAELFTVFGDKKFIVLRFWLYWIHTNYSKNSLLGRETLYDDKLPPDEQARKSLWESFNIECPDNERFDFLIDTNKKKVIWVGTDFHYQESWYKFDENKEFVKARIANDVNTIEQVLTKLKDRFNQPKENYNPMTYLKEILKDPDRQKGLTLEHIPNTEERVASNVEDNGNVLYRPIGFTRKHVPYTVNGKAVAELISSVVTS